MVDLLLKREAETPIRRVQAERDGADEGRRQSPSSAQGGFGRTRAFQYRDTDRVPAPFARAGLSSSVAGKESEIVVYSPGHV